MRLQILHQRHDHDHEHARTVSLHPLLYFLSPTHHASHGYRRAENITYAASPRAPPPRCVVCTQPGVTRTRRGCYASVAVVVDARAGPRATREVAPPRALRSSRSRRDAPARTVSTPLRPYRLILVVVVRRRSSPSVGGVGSTRGVFVRVSRARDVSLARRSARRRW